MDETRELIEQLRDLKLQESQIRIRETQIINRLEEINDNRRANARANASSTQGNTERDIFEPGDRVRIKNKYKVSGPLTRIKEDGDRIATVTKTHKDKNGIIDKVYILTDNGFATWRLPKNLQLLSE